MQINNRSSQFYPVVSYDNKTKLPIVYSDQQAFKPVSSENRTDTTQVITPLDKYADGQQARFVRSFISSDRGFEQAPRQQQIPYGVKQYIETEEVDKLNGERGKRIDEIV